MAAIGAMAVIAATSEMDTELGRGVYDTPRAAALAGVPRSTLHYWAREGIYRPAISPGPRVRLWSWFDLLSLRTIDWLRHHKGAGEPPRVSMQKIRQSLLELEKRGIPHERWHKLAAVSRGGELFFEFADERAVRAAPGQQGGWPSFLYLVHPYQHAPDLLEPRPLLRIIPGKLHGEPHLLDTRIPSATIFSLAQMGYTITQIQEMYPESSPEAIRQAVDLERSLHAWAA